MTRPILVVAGEASGDRAAAAVIARMHSTRFFGYGGELCRNAGAQLLDNASGRAAMGIVAVLPNVRRLAHLRAKILTETEHRQARVALLVNFSEFNATLLEPLRKLGVKTVFYGPPQVWAWRPRRARVIARKATHVAAMLPFEEPLWRRAGASVTYVGHPSAASFALSQTGEAQRCTDLCALLPGSRDAEVRRNLPLMLEAAKLLSASGLRFRAYLATSLSKQVRAQALQSLHHAYISVEDVNDATPLAARLHSATVAIAVSGTATLECALAGVPMVVVYRTGQVLATAAKYLLHTEHIALPNILLKRRAFPELVGAAFSASDVRRCVQSLVARIDDARADCMHVALSLRTQFLADYAVAEILNRLESA